MVTIIIVGVVAAGLGYAWDMALGAPRSRKPWPRS